MCTGCSWDDGARGAGGVPAVGDRFTGKNCADGRTWETRSVVVASEPGVEIAWQVNEDWVRWGFFTAPADPAGESTLLTETWAFLPAGLAGFRARDGGEAAIDHRTRLAREGIPATLTRVKAVAEDRPGPAQR